MIEYGVCLSWTISHRLSEEAVFTFRNEQWSSARHNLSEGILHVVIMEISRNADCIYRE